jgi:hypothetical protein
MSKLIVDNAKSIVYDDLLPPEEHDAAWAYIQQDDYEVPTRWSKLWRANDDEPMMGKLYCSSEKPFNNFLDQFSEHVTELANTHAEFVGPWKTFSLRSYIYRRGSKLSWHDDSGHTAAVVFYAHKHWGSTWGGELLIAETPHVREIPPSILSHQWEDRFMLSMGVGHYIMPKPNRAVITKAGTWHSINRIDSDAGDNLRCSIVAFFKN